MRRRVRGRGGSEVGMHEAQYEINFGMKENWNEKG